MRQLVSIVNDGFIRYYLAEGSDLEEVARIRVGEKFSPEQAVILGINVVEAVGKIQPTREPAMAAVEAAPTPPKRGPGRPKKDRTADTPRKGPKGDRIVWKDTITYDKVMTALRAQPNGITTQEIAKRLGYPTDAKARKAVANRLGVMRKDSQVDSKRDADGDYLWFIPRQATPSTPTPTQTQTPTQTPTQPPIPVSQSLGSPMHAMSNGQH